PVANGTLENLIFLPWQRGAPIIGCATSDGGGGPPSLEQTRVSERQRIIAPVFRRGRFLGWAVPRLDVSSNPAGNPGGSNGVSRSFSEERLRGGRPTADPVRLR